MKAILFLFLFLWVGCSSPQVAGPIARGRYITVITGCNDCHTSGWPQSGGKTPEADWLVGTNLGYYGPWGTTYPTNLRIFFSQITEDQWVNFAKTFKIKPPMPYWALNNMNEEDLRALYRFVHSLGPKGEPAPAPLSPGEKPKTPYLVFTPIEPFH